MELLHVQKMYSDMRSAERLRTKTNEREDVQDDQQTQDS